jgi:spore coat protein H
MDLKYYGDDIQAYPTQNGQYAYGKMNNEDEADYHDIVELCRAIDGTQYPSEDEFMQAIEDAINVDAFLRYIAVVTILDNWDSYPYTGNNFYLFNNPVSGRFEWIPWDLTWGGNSNTPLFGRADPGLIGDAPLYDRVFEVEAYQRQYAAYVDLLLRYWFNPGNITQKAQAYNRMIAPYISQSTGDTAFYGPQPMFPPEAFTNAWGELVDFTSQRHDFLAAQLQQVWP